MNVQTVGNWVRACGWSSQRVDSCTLRIARPADPDSRFFVRCTDHWLLLAITPALERDSDRPADFERRLLAVNRDIRLAKYAVDEEGDVLLSAELPTETLAPEVFRDAVERMRRYVEYYRAYLLARPDS